MTLRTLIRSSTKKETFTFSQKFNVIPPKYFPGSMVSSDLTIIFKKQGVRLTIKKQKKQINETSISDCKLVDTHDSGLDLFEN
ncbi:hypothetical protein HK099_004593 [Clydaea vesicula]|uniref:Velvet domain-containing protein n=1 Tax=Clydaea vesicula TaxID=447962 RepID=A0AAD5XYJ4_9FUNG|nr:hypothetical protein HK099_004593 [Clydaea vesicula]